MSLQVVKKELIKLLSNDRDIEFSIDALVRGLSGVKHKVDIYISHPCNLAIIVPQGDLEIELIKAVLICVDIRVPVILLVNKVESAKYRKDFQDILGKVPVKVIMYESPIEECYKLYREIIKECNI